ncbi:hypothetical protein [Gimesia fumaroli]|uniref:Carboxypeptidase regulatory-like domain-containing protein n=1 Tax=Gimesia fumaroli TaxID=2527976 RepID=A0A518I924_9PLAN|nr:hypothetical protein [Gimesia fumaroli]QDV49613.1 hypothetical protein Enr17x_16340 [Gimesia fumaroli]
MNHVHLALEKIPVNRCLPLIPLPFKRTCLKLFYCTITVSLFTVSSSGCSQSASEGPERAAVSGHVKFKGAPVEVGTITFVPISPNVGPSTGAKISAGTYSIPQDTGPVIGTNRVEITAYQKTGNKIEAGTPNPPGTMVDELKSIIPKEYNQKSKLTAQIDNGENKNIDFDLGE